MGTVLIVHGLPMVYPWMRYPGSIRDITRISGLYWTDKLKLPLMTHFPIDYFQVVLQENIPLSEDEIKHIDKQRSEFFKDAPGILMTATLFIMAIAYYFIQHEINLQYYHYILFVFAGIAMFGLFYLFVWLTFRSFKNDWKKDIINGKNKLSSVIISRHKTENDEYIVTFAGRHKGEKFSLPVKKADYYHYPIGTKVLVSYLKYSKEVLEITEL
ncbi:hypothetical protein [Chitinophaga sp. ARDCPP14]|uniref:hypothetical protein n=1 Tax=Chitinophaga sp. ARDCPP14 TaxID=3391139 RepID=UPI003F5229E6